MAALRQLKRTLHPLLPILSTFLLVFSAVAGSRGQSMSGHLSTITHRDKTFTAELDSYFPGISTMPNYEYFAPFMVLLKNDGGPIAQAYELSWTVAGSDGTSHKIATTTYIRRFFTPKPDLRMISQGQVRLLTPLYNISPEDYRANHDFGKRYPTSLLPHVLAASLPSLTSQLNGVVFVDKSVTGDTKDVFLRRFRCARNADYDELLAVVARPNALENKTAFQDFLLQERSLHATKASVGPAIDGGPSWRDLYRQNRREAAAALLIELHTRSFENVVGAVRRLVLRAPLANGSSMQQSYQSKP